MLEASPVSTVQTPSTPRRRKRWNNDHIVTSSDEEEPGEPSDEELDEGEFWIKGIIDETESQYKIDWEDLGETSYTPSWVPKSDLNELAIQVWEQEKKEQRASQGNGVPIETPPQTQSSPSESEERSAEASEQDTGPQDSTDSPLFVPLDAVSDWAQSQENNEPLPLRLDISNFIQPNNESKFTAEPHHVFESFPSVPIPREYRLPGESGEPLSSVSQQAEDNRSSNLAGATHKVSQAFQSRPTAAVEASLRTEIPETPSISQSFWQSQDTRVDKAHRREEFQISRVNSQLGVFRPQRSADSISFHSSTLPSRVSRIPGSSRTPRADNLSPAYTHTNLDICPVYPAAARTTSVPESSPASDSRYLVHQSPATHAAQASVGSISFTSNTLSSQIPLSNRTLLLGNTNSTSRRFIRTGSVPESVAVSKSPSLTRFSATQSAMDDKSQKKDEISLAETMERYSHIEGSTPREKIRNAYARLREKSTVEALQNDPSATPSSVGDIEPSAPIPVPETVAPLSVRVDKEPSQHADLNIESAPQSLLEGTELQEHDIQTIQPSALTVSHAEQVSRGSLHLGTSEFAVPLPMDSRVKDDYERVLSETQKSPGCEEQVVSSMQQVLERLSNAATHPDLNIAQHIKDAESNLEQEAAWAEYSSAKFLLLSYLIKAADDHDLHLVIAVRGEKSQRVVERYLKGKGLAYTRPREEMGLGTNVEVSMMKGSLSFGIQMTAHGDGIVETYKPPTALIALDSSLSTQNPFVEHMRTTYARNGHLLPVIRLMVANSSEHVELCFPGPPTLERLSLVLQNSRQLRDIVGDLQDDALGVHEDANEILTCLLSDNFNAFWSLPPVEPLRGASLSEPARDVAPNKSSAENDNLAVSTAQKRVFVQDTSEPASKRPRMDEYQDTSQLTDSSKAVTQTLDNDLQTLEQHLTQMKSSHAAAIEKLQKALVATQSRLQEREKILESLQHRYETRTKDFHKARQDRDLLLEAKTASEQKLDRQKEDITKLKDERTQLRHDLEQAREALKNGGGNMAELESAREENRRLIKENASLERKAEYEHKQVEYTREQYQTASNVAAQSGNEIRQLKEENEALQKKAASEAVRLRELNMRNEEARHLSRIAELESLLSSREDLLQRKEDELREIRRNRPSTRSTSTQPRSPKLTTANSRPTSPGINNGSNFTGRGSALRFSSEMSL